MKIFITGGSGFIGSYLTNALLTRDHKVTVFEKYLNFTGKKSYYMQALTLRENLFRRKPHVISGDIRSKKQVTDALRDTQPDVVVHLAAISNARPPTKFEHLMGPINLYGSLTVFAAAENTPSVRRIIFPSSSFAYGSYSKNPQPEDAPLAPQNDYGKMKAACEYALQLSRKEWVILRPTSVYGFTDAANRVTQLLWDAALSGKPAWVVAGEALDFTYVDDVVDGFVRAITGKKAARHIFNISRGIARTSEDFAQILKRYFPDFSYEVRETSANLISRGAMDISKAKKLLRYQPKFDIEDGIARTLRLMKKYGQI